MASNKDSHVTSGLRKQYEGQNVGKLPLSETNYRKECSHTDNNNYIMQTFTFRNWISSVFSNKAPILAFDDKPTTQCKYANESSASTSSNYAIRMRNLMCGLRTWPLADADPQNLSDQRTNSGFMHTKSW